MFYSPFIPILDDFQQNLLSERFQKCLVYGIVGNDALAAARKPVGNVIKSVVVNLTVQVAFNDAGRGYVLKDIALAQTSVHEQVDAHALFSRHDLQVPRLLDRSNKTSDATKFHLFRFVVASILPKRSFEPIQIGSFRPSNVQRNSVLSANTFRYLWVIFFPSKRMLKVGSRREKRK